MTIRLLNCAQEGHLERRARPAWTPGLAEALGVSSATMTNWKSRGVSKDGALAAEQLFGCSPRWVMEGDAAFAPASHAASEDHAWMTHEKRAQPSEPESQQFTTHPSEGGSTDFGKEHAPSRRHERLTKDTGRPRIAYMSLIPRSRA